MKPPMGPPMKPPPAPRRHRILAALAILGLLCALVPLAARIRVESADYRNVEIAPAAAEFRADRVGLAALRRAGARAVFVDEQSVGDLEAAGLVTLRPVPGGTRLLASPAVAAWLRTRLPSWPVVSQTPDALRGRLVGFWRGDLRAIAAAGLAIDARIYDVAALADLRGFPVHAAWFAAGLPDVPPGAAAAFDVPLGVAEGPQQLGNVPAKGLPQLFRATGSRAVRVFDPAPALYIANNARDTELETLRAAESRNVRVLVMHPVPGLTPRLQTGMIAATVSLLHAHGYRLAPPIPLPPLRVPPWAAAGIAIGAAAAAVLLADLLGAGAWSWVFAPMALLDPSLAADLAVPGLALFWLAQRQQRGGLLNGWLDAALAAALALAGGILVGGDLASQAYMMEWALFRGVKLLLLVPPAIAVLAVWRAGLWLPPKRLLEDRLRAWHLLVILGLLFVAYVYLARSGNGGAALAPAFEVRMRDWFDAHLMVRPREKEFVFGWPALVLAGFAARRSRAWYGVLLVVGSLGSASVADTFAHVRTAFAISALRTGYGLAIGLALGTLGYGLAWAISWYSSRYRCAMRSRVNR